ncbi:MAG: hypothetical protein KFH87_12615 [Bacteroidetes bacterium]|nr:hypothetical protein [Bacteroidota bacterium]
MTTSTCASTSMRPSQHARQPACAPTRMRANQGVAADRAVARSARFRLFLITCLFAFSPTLLHAQIDLCSLSGGIVLEAGVQNSATVKVPAGTTIRVTLLRECEPERNVESYNGIYFNFYDYVAVEWVSEVQNQNSKVGILEEFPVDQHTEIDIELDACEGTRVRVECV